jgi:hypothetical protein
MDARLNKAEQAFLRVLDGAICVFFTFMAGAFALGGILAIFSLFTSDTGIVGIIGAAGCAGIAYTLWSMRR